MMIILEMMFFGFVVGMPVGAIAKSLWDRKHGKDQCRGIMHGERCPSHKSTVCVDSLCPEHCNQLHEGKCVSKFT